MSYEYRTELSELLNKVLVSVKNDGSEIEFTTNNAEVFKLLHFRDCCESVIVEDIEGDLNDLVGYPILQAEEISNDEFEKKWEADFKTTKWGSRNNSKGEYYPESHTWTFYKFATVIGYVTIRFLGESNGNYSESVDFIKMP